ncbi:hypothetical protein DICVIV_05187 [Dictyocaulus viviparus]|uniref:Uncharacterized protein n=1 Tax=Dictyocaulus viviparus TaxID=29172 RepID=A0A0D8Y296_DICVI|nr:hypothetical protein DICVIV_05187 [Dictyocaulus viviparus]
MTVLVPLIPRIFRFQYTTLSLLERTKTFATLSSNSSSTSTRIQTNSDIDGVVHVEEIQIHSYRIRQLRGIR